MERRYCRVEGGTRDQKQERLRRLRGAGANWGVREMPWPRGGRRGARDQNIPGLGDGGGEFELAAAKVSPLCNATCTEQIH